MGVRIGGDYIERAVFFLAVVYSVSLDYECGREENKGKCFR